MCLWILCTYRSDVFMLMRGHTVSCSQILWALAPRKVKSQHCSVAHINLFISNCPAKQHVSAYRLRCLIIILATINDPFWESALTQMLPVEDHNTHVTELLAPYHFKQQHILCKRQILLIITRHLRHVWSLRHDTEYFPSLDF